jgi:hypothetical protein
VEAWRDLSTPGVVPEHALIPLTWPAAATPRRLPTIEKAPPIAAAPIELPVAPKAEVVTADSALAVVDIPPLQQALDTVEQVLDLNVIAQRYPLLRNSI